jgi:hypothetical protein
MEFEQALQRLLEPAAYQEVSTAAAKRVREIFTIEHFWRGINAQYALANSAAFAPQKLRMN